MLCPRLRVCSAYNPVYSAAPFSALKEVRTDLAVPYTASIAPERPVYDQGVSSIKVLGHVGDIWGNSLSSFPVVVAIRNNGYSRVLYGMTDSTGDYRVNFTPNPGEAGVYDMGGGSGFGFNYRDYSATVLRGSVYSFDVVLKVGLVLEKLMVKNLILAAAWAILSVSGAGAETPVISCANLNRNLAERGVKMSVVDVRGAADFARGHIPGAINAPYDGIEKAALPKEGILVLYCGNNQCPWSKLGARTLENAGYKNVLVLDGGISAWTAEGYALETASGVEKKSIPAPVEAIAPAVLLKLLSEKTVGVLDIRPAGEFKIAHIPGAKNIPPEGLENALAGLSKETEWVVYDKQAENAKTAVRLMTGKGFKAKELAGGIQVWSARKYPLETGSSK